MLYPKCRVERYKSPSQKYLFTLHQKILFPGLPASEIACVLLEVAIGWSFLGLFFGLFVFVEKYQYFGGSSWKSQIKDVHTIHCTIRFLTD